MFRLLSIELHKLKYNKASKVLTIIYFVLLSLLVLTSFMEVDLGFAVLNFSEYGIFEFPFIWHFNTYIALLLKIFLLLIIVSMVSMEYSNKTLKQNLIDGLSKKEYVLSKFYMVILYALSSTVYITLVSLILGYSFSTDTSFNVIVHETHFLFSYFIRLLSFLSFGLFAGILIKRSAFAMGAMLIWRIFELIIVESFSSVKILSSIFPFTNMEQLITQPFKRLSIIQEMMGESDQVYEMPTTHILISLGWTAFFILMSYLIIKKRDL